MAATACTTDPVLPAEWKGLQSWRSFVDARRGLDAEGTITALVCAAFFRVCIASSQHCNSKAVLILTGEYIDPSCEMPVCVQVVPPWDSRCAEAKQQAESLAEHAVAALLTPDPLEKAAVTHHAFERFCSGGMPVGVADAPARVLRPTTCLLICSNI